MKKRLLIALIIILVLIIIGLTVRHNGTADKDSGLMLYGNIDVRVANLAFETSGRIATMAVQEGERVSAGQRLARLDDRRLQLARDAAQAQLTMQQARLDELLAGTRPEQIQQYRAQRDAARIEAENAEHNAVRLRELVKQKQVSAREADDARAVANAARARAAAAAATLKLAEVGSRAETIAAARAAVAAAAAQRDLAQENLDDSILYAPEGGVIQSRILEPGDMASPQQPVYTLVMTEPQWARVYVSETNLGRVKPGQAVTIHSDSFPGHSYAGWVGAIAPSAEFTPKSVETTEIRTDLVYQVRVYLCDISDELRQGMPVTVRIDTGAMAASTTCAGLRSSQNEDSR
jgi:HlyD family secretion protein